MQEMQLKTSKWHYLSVAINNVHNIKAKMGIDLNL